MITLTTPHLIRTVVGGATTISFDKVVIAPMAFNGVTQVITGSVRVSSTTTPTEPAIVGSFTASVTTAELVLDVPTINIRRRVVLGSAENTALIAQIETVQEQIENGLLALGVVAGVRTPGV